LASLQKGWTVEGSGVGFGSSIDSIDTSPLKINFLLGLRQCNLSQRKDQKWLNILLLHYYYSQLAANGSETVGGDYQLGLNSLKNPEQTQTRHSGLGM